nr:hypothetical protein [Tanacetum cinerariifolium]
MEYLQNEHYALLEVIEFGDSYKAPPEETGKGPASESSARKKGRTVAITMKDMQKRRNDVKARTTLLLALPDEHQLRISKLQAIVSNLKFMDVKIEQDDLNQKFLTSLAPEWLMYTIVWRNRDDLDTMSLDDVYDHLKVYEPEVQKKSESNSQNMAFISLSNTSSGKGKVHTASVPTASTQVSTASTDVAAASLSHDTICAYIATQSNGFQIKYEDITQIDEDDIEEIDIKWNMALLSMRADRFWKKTEQDCNADVPESSGISNPTATLKVPSADQVEPAISLNVESKILTVSSYVLTVFLDISPKSSSGPRLISKGVISQKEAPSLGNALTLSNRFEDTFGDTTNAVTLNEVEADLSNMDTSIPASLTPTFRTYKDHTKSQIIGPVDTPEEPKKIFDALKDPSCVEDMQEELLQFKIQNVWVFVDCPKGVRPIGTIWVLKNKKDERGIVIRNKARLVAQGYTHEEGIGYEEVFTPVAKIEAIRLFLAYASFMGFIVYQIDVKSAFLYGTIDEEAPRAWYGTLSKYLLDNGFQRGTIDQALFIRKHKGEFLLVQVYVDDIIFRSSNPQLCREFEALMRNKFQMSVMGELTFFLGLQVLQKKDGIFLSQDKSMIGSLMYLPASKPDIMFAVCDCARHQVTPKECHLHRTIVVTSTTEAEYVAAASGCGQVLWIQNQMLDYG